MILFVCSWACNNIIILYSIFCNYGYGYFCEIIKINYFIHVKSTLYIFILFLLSANIFGKTFTYDTIKFILRFDIIL